MLRDAGVRTKLLAVLAIPTLLLAVVTGLLVANQVTEARRAGQINALTEVAVQVNAVVHSLQEERSVTLNHLQSPSGGAARTRWSPSGGSPTSSCASWTSWSRHRPSTGCPRRCASPSLGPPPSTAS